MMKNIAVVALTLASFAVLGQRTEDPIEYYTDDKVQDTRFSVAAAYAPMYSFRRVAFYEPVNDGSELFSLLSEDGGGMYGQRYGVNMYYELNPYFHVGVGFNQENGGFISKELAVFDQYARPAIDTIGVFNAQTSYASLNIPIQMVFHTQMTEFWALQVIPSYDLMFMQTVERNWIGENLPSYASGADESVLGLMYQRGTETKYASGFNGSIGFALGSEFTIANNLAFIVRGEFRLGLLPVNTNDLGLREVPYATGGMFGFRYYL